MKKPVNLIFGLDDKPPLSALILLGLQHSTIIFISMIFPVLIIRELGEGIGAATALGFISLSMIAAGLTSILQAVRKGPFGSGFLCPSLCGPAYLSASMQAVGFGGLHLLFGMTAFVGGIEMLISRIMHKLRFLFPVEVTGTVVALVGIVIIPLAVKNLFGINAQDTVSTTPEVLTGVLTLAALALLNVFGGKSIRLFTLLIGLVIGYVLSFIFGIVPREELQQLINSPWFSLPYIRQMGWSFDATLIIPFTVATMCSTLKTVGDLVTCQKINDAEWKRPDMKLISSGILVDGLGGVIPGVIGGFGQSTSSANVGLSIASGATSRRIAFSLGFILIFLAFFPKMSAIFILMPKPVMGATLIFTISFMIMSGLQILTSRMLDTRKIFVAGFSIIFGLSADMLPELYDGLHPWIAPIFDSSLALGTTVAVLLNLLFKAGTNRPVKLSVSHTPDVETVIYQFFEKNGGRWGARKEVIYRVITSCSELSESVYGNGLTTGKISFRAAFTEELIEVTAQYNGPPIDPGTVKPDINDLVSDEKSYLKLAAYLARSVADKMDITAKNGQTRIVMLFDH